jgi:hypothetical protein
MDFMRWIKYQWDRFAAGVLCALGLLALLLGYVGISGSVYPAEQLPYMISGGVLGIFCLGMAGVLYLSADMRDEWRKLDSIDATLRELAGGETTDIDGATQPAPAAAEPVGEEPTAVRVSPEAPASGAADGAARPKASPPRRSRRAPKVEPVPASAAASRARVMRSSTVAGTQQQ